jgi:transposase
MSNRRRVLDSEQHATTLEHKGAAMLLIGWDWAEASHAVAVMDPAGQVIDQFTITHDETGLASALRRLAHHGSPDQLPVAIETTNGLVVDRLLAAGHPVVPIHPNAFHAARPRWGAARAKTDPGDAAKLADYLRTDGHRLRRLAPTDQATRRLQALTRTRDELVAAKVAATNQLDAVLDAHWPGAAAIFGRLDSPIALAFLDRYPTPQHARHLGHARLRRFLVQHAYCGRRTPQQLLDRLHAAPHAPNSLDSDTVAAVVGAHVMVLRILLGQLVELERAIRAVLDEHLKANLLASLPRIGRVNLAQVLAEIGPILDTASSVEHATVEAGAAPVTRKSGKRQQVSFRWQANPRARQALMTFADNSRHASPWAAKRYADARRRGKRHPHAERILARAWLRVIWACWHAGTVYNPAMHDSEQRLATAQHAAA